jgi:hypothetical protein
MSLLQLNFHPLLQTVNLNASLDDIFGLDQIINLNLSWNRMSLENIKSALRKQGGKKRWEIVSLGQVHQEMNDSDIIEISSYLPSLIDWTGFPPRSTLTIDGAREWKRICPRLETLRFTGGRLSGEVKKVLQGLGVRFK